MRLISLFDFSGTWSAPWRATHDVVQVDIQHGQDVLDVKPGDFTDVDVVLAAPPCTYYTKAGSRYWAQWDADGTTEASVRLVRHTLDLIRAWAPRVWCIENPAGRLPLLVPELSEVARLTVQPWHFAGWVAPEDRTLVYCWLDLERAKKTTVLWGRFFPPTRRPEEAQVCPGGQTATSWIGPGAGRKNLRSRTPTGLARAFHDANQRRA